MKIKTEQLDRLVDNLLRHYQAKQLVILKAKEADIRVRIRKILEQNFREEEVIEAEAREMLASHALQVREMDHHKMFLLLKQKLAQKKGFIL
jgi:hypothetical protein